MQFMYVGAWLNQEGKGGIHCYQVDESTGDLKKTAVYQEDIAAGFLCMSPDKNYLYVVDETKTWRSFVLDKGYRGGRILSFKINRETGELTYLNEIPSCGCNPNYLCIDREGKWLCAVNYGTNLGPDKLSVRSVKNEDGHYEMKVIPDETSVILVSLKEDGSLEEITDLHVIDGEPTHFWEEFQCAPHAHSVNFSAGGDCIVVTDRGCDVIYLFKVNRREKKLELSAFCSTPKGFGPRNTVFNREKNIVYVIGEIQAYIVAYEYDAEKGILKEIQRLATVEEKDLADFKKMPETFAEFFQIPLQSEIIMHPNGKSILVTTRWTNTVTVFSIQDNGLLERVQVHTSGGSWPRTCTVDATGKYLYVGNQKANQIALLEMGDSGIKDTNIRFDMDCVSCIRIFELN